VGKALQKYRLRTRDGYSLQQASVTASNDSEPAVEPDPR